jgi:RNA recognition motif-containing protein
MSKKIYIGNLPFRVDENTLKDLFEKIGEVQSVKIITDVATGRSKGFGFIEMVSDEDVEKAISALNGTMVMGRPLTVNRARPQQSSRNKGGFRERGKKSYRGGSGLDNWR